MNMGEYLDQIPEAIQEHVKVLAKTSNKAGDEDFIEAIAKGWLEKMKSFEAETALFQMEQTDILENDNPNGALLMTYSGSLLNIGPLVDGTRKVEYSSIGLRQDVPDKASKDDSVIDGDMQVDEVVAFKKGPIKKSSPIFKIAVLKEELPAEEQEEKLAEATQVLTDNFVEVNKTIIMDQE
jgi:hypothetical protein